MEWGLAADVDLGSAARWPGLEDDARGHLVHLRLKASRDIIVAALHAAGPQGRPLRAVAPAARRAAAAALAHGAPRRDLPADDGGTSYVDETTPMAGPLAWMMVPSTSSSRGCGRALARVDLIDGFKLDGGKHIHKRSFQSHRYRPCRRRLRPHRSRRRGAVGRDPGQTPGARRFSRRRRHARISVSPSARPAPLARR